MIPHLDTYVVSILFVIIGMTEVATGLYFDRKRRSDDWLIDFISVAQLAIIIKPLIILTAGWLMSQVFPNFKDSLSEIPLWAAVLMIMIPDEFSHYWYHRLAHENPKIWKLHRTHHSSNDYQVTLAFRENWLWFVCMPGLWWSASMVYFGFGEAYIISTMIIGTHNVLIHSGYPWDNLLYKVRFLKPFTWVLERTIQLPSTHKAHHGLGENASTFGNYGQFIFLWDVIFKTAHFPHEQAPEKYGISNDTQDKWYSQLWWPIVKASNPKSEHHS